MKAAVWRGVGDIRLEDVPDPEIKEPADALVRLTASAICGTDLHFIRGTYPGLKNGTILGHEGVGIIEDVGRDVRNLSVGDRVVVPSSIACGNCPYCRSGCFAQCDSANPNGRDAGTAFYGGPEQAGGFGGLQAELARVPFAAFNLVKLPDDITDDQAILLSDIFPTGYFAAENADIKPGNTVAVLGCGPVGQFCIASARLMSAGRIFAVDCEQSRLEMARDQGAEVINFDEDEPVQTIRRLTDGVGVDRVIDAVGVDSETAHRGPAMRADLRDVFAEELRRIAPVQHPSDGSFHPGTGPSQALIWAVGALAKAGTLSIVGAYPPGVDFFPLGRAMNKNLTIRMGTCNHKKYISKLVEVVRSGVVDPTSLLTQRESLDNILDAYKRFDRREAGWVKVEILPRVGPQQRRVDEREEQYRPH